MRTLVILLMSTATMNSFSQINSIWIGNTPGHKQDWNCPSNWNNNRLPDEFTDVIIPLDDSITDNYPNFKSGRSEINSLSIWPGANLTMKGGELLILNTDKNYYDRNQIMGRVKANWEGETLHTSEELASLKVD